MLKEKILLFPAPVRIFHWIFAISLTIAILTGIVPGLEAYTRQPIMPLRTVRLLHVSSGFICLGAVIFRAGYAFISGDYKDFGINLQDIKTLPALVKYYLFIEKNPPPLRTKLNIGQKFIYLSWLVAIIYLSLTGILLLDSYFTAYGRFFYFLQRLILPQTNRFVRYHLTIYMIVTILVHIYLAHTEDIARSQAIITGWVRVRLKK